MEKQETLIERLARKQGITVEEMREQIAMRIRKGLSDTDPNRRLQWEQIPHVGDIPTPEEYLDYVLKWVYKEGCEELLKQYLMSSFGRNSYRRSRDGY